MAIVYAPSEKGFDPRLEAIDRCQITLLRDLSHQLGNRLVLKGGVAMRVAFGSMRLTKDIDFDRDQRIGQDTLVRNLDRMLIRAAGLARIQNPNVQITKNTSTTVRARIEGTIENDTDVRFDVEVSGRSPPSGKSVRSEVVVPPAKYAMAPFPVVTYTNPALAVMKIGAALSEQRNAPRDLYDLRDLIWAHTDPTELLAQQDTDLLEDFITRAPAKLELLSFELAQQELLPYLPPESRHALDEANWLDATIMVSQTIQHWCRAALAQQRGPARPLPSAVRRP